MRRCYSLSKGPHQDGHTKAFLPAHSPTLPLGMTVWIQLLLPGMCRDVLVHGKRWYIWWLERDIPVLPDPLGMLGLETSAWELSCSQVQAVWSTAPAKQPCPASINFQPREGATLTVWYRWDARWPQPSWHWIISMESCPADLSLPATRGLRTPPWPTIEQRNTETVRHHVWLFFLKFTELTTLLLCWCFCFQTWHSRAEGWPDSVVSVNSRNLQWCETTRSNACGLTWPLTSAPLPLLILGAFLSSCQGITE